MMSDVGANPLPPSLYPPGEHLRVCPQGYTCCTSAMEESLANLSRMETERSIKVSGQIQQAIINAHYKAFDGEGVFSPVGSGFRFVTVSYV